MNETIEEGTDSPAGDGAEAEWTLPLIMTRRFAVSREKVWKAWTCEEHLMHWFAPKGLRLVINKLDVSAEGTFDYLLHSQDATIIASTVRGRFRYREIVVPERLLFISSFFDEQSNPAVPPFMPEGPGEVLSMITFSEHRERTSVTLRFVPATSTVTARKAFAEARADIRRHWTGTLDQLDRFLAKD